MIKKDDIKNNIDNPELLEKLYQEDRKAFSQAFFKIYDEIAENDIATFWKTRLEFTQQKEERVTVRKNDLFVVLLTYLVTAVLIKSPQIFGLNVIGDFFYIKNVGLIVFFGLSMYVFLTKKKLNLSHVLISLLVFAGSAVYVNLLPSNVMNDSIMLVYLHLPLMLWCLYGLVYINFDVKDVARRIDYIQYMGDLAILYAIIALVGGILTAVTLGLFDAIGLNIEQFYFEYIIPIGAVCAPIVATFIIKKLPFIKNQLAPIIAKVFSPLVLLTLIIYLSSILITGKNLYHDRDFLIVFNLLLLGVMAIIVFSLSETAKGEKQKFNEIILFILTILTLVVDLIALSAILYRLREFGFTPNRTAVLGSNLLIFVNLVLILIDLIKVNFKGRKISKVEIIIARYLPVYMIWTVIVVFGFPLIFGLQ
ncbi:MAG: DUF4173 domain-containing protein [Candidatus Cloacimonetes bacterium]|nr:DUF4173 domain-containing protein [Candidatus Cloacimonadota bacterium]